MAMTDAQARAYIQGEEPFDEFEWRKRHAERLCKTVEDAAQKIEACNLPNLIKTAKHYARNDSLFMQANPKAKARLEALIHELEDRTTC